MNKKAIQIKVLTRNQEELYQKNAKRFVQIAEPKNVEHNTDQS